MLIVERPKDRIEQIGAPLKDFQFVQTGSQLTYLVEVNDTTPKNKAILNFQNIYANKIGL